MYTWFSLVVKYCKKLTTLIVFKKLKLCKKFKINSINKSQKDWNTYQSDLKLTLQKNNSHTYVNVKIIDRIIGPLFIKIYCQ